MDVWANVLDFVTDVRDLERVRLVCRLFRDLTHKRARFRKKRVCREAIKRACKADDLEGVTFLLDCLSGRWCSKYCMRHDPRGVRYEIKLHGPLSDIIDKHFHRCFRHVLDVAAAGGNMDVIQLLRERTGFGCTRSGILRAFKNGHVCVLRWHKMLGNDAPKLHYSLESGVPPLESAQCFHELWPINRKELRHMGVRALEDGRIDIADWVGSLGVEFPTPEDLYPAVMGGHISAVEWILKAYPDLDTKRGHTGEGEPLSWRQFVGYNDVLVSHLANHERFAMIDWWYDAHPSWSFWSNEKGGHFLGQIAVSGNLEFLQKQCRRMPQCRIANYYISQCAQRGLFQTLQWLYEKRHFVLVYRNAWTDDPSILNEAASSGNIDLVRWLHGIGAPCTKLATQGAIKGGHLGVVRWLYYNRIEGFSGDALNLALNYGHLAIAVWLLKQDPRGVLFNAPSANLIHTQHTIRWVLRNNLMLAEPHPPTTFWAAGHGNLALMEILLEYGMIENDTQAFVVAAKEGCLDMVRWLCRHAPGLTPETYRKAYLAAVREGFFKAGKFLRNFKPEWVDPRDPSLEFVDRADTLTNSRLQRARVFIS